MRFMAFSGNVSSSFALASSPQAVLLTGPFHQRALQSLVPFVPHSIPINGLDRPILAVASQLEACLLPGPFPISRRPVLSFCPPLSQVSLPLCSPFVKRPSCLRIFSCNLFCAGAFHPCKLAFPFLAILPLSNQQKVCCGHAIRLVCVYPSLVPLRMSRRYALSSGFSRVV